MKKYIFKNNVNDIINCTKLKELVERKGGIVAEKKKSIYYRS